MESIEGIEGSEAVVLVASFSGVASSPALQ